MVRPGQAWCVVTSPVEGDTHLQVYVPGIFNWDQRIKTTVVRWVDAVWEFPARVNAEVRAFLGAFHAKRPTKFGGT